ncbi:carbohydrate ABC transporter permease [Blautia sp. Marseille-P3201T]|uniref:carbohydrate ABC transporter permease n=1 Tax=Blautia sp. Marseille-P3201T TaxID=1907659 RepID=UPI0009318CDC|nr:sugar ABC transporter permease [Blautia sp. Marseille-P3201T]
MEEKTTLTEFRKMNSVKKKRIVRKNMWCWVFMLPTLLLYILFQGYPIITSAWYSMLDWSGMTMNATFVGLQNFKELLADPLFRNSVANSFKYMIFSVPIQLILSLVIAYILTSIIKKGATVFRTMYFIPVITTASIVGIIMIFIFGGTGPINQVLALLGIDTINFLGDEKTALFTVVLIGIWKDLGTYMIYWIAALQSVSQDVYEAAKIDGAGKFRTFTDVVFPLILPIGGVITVLCVIGSLKVFDIVQTMTNGGPYFATDVVATFVYRTAYSSTTGSPRLGYASAAALLFGLMVVTIGIVLNLVKNYFNKKRNV